MKALVVGGGGFVGPYLVRHLKDELGYEVTVTKTEKETLALKELQQQEKVCMEHYTLYANTAKDCGLRDLFSQIAQDEQEHYQMLGEVLKGKIPSFSHAASIQKLPMILPPVRQINSMMPCSVQTVSEMKN